MRENTKKYGFAASAVLLTIAILVGLLVGVGNKDNKDKASAESPTTSVPSDEDDARECGDTWLIVQSDNDHNRWFADGVTAIDEADSPEEARNAAHEWLSLVRRDPQLLAAASMHFLDRPVDESTLVDGKCASSAAETLTAEIELTIAQAKVTPSEAPADGYNSGVSDGNVVTAANPGITGDRTAILIELPNGKKIWIMARCGNPVVTEKPPIPEGPTDEPEKPEKPTTTTTVPPTTTTTRPCPPGTHPEGGGCVHDSITDPDPCASHPELNIDVCQPPQDNDTSGVNTGPTPGAPSEPSTPPPGPEPEDGTVAPPPNDGGYDSGSPDGSGTPDGSACDSTGCTGGGSEPAEEGPPPTVDDGTYGGNPGGFE